MEYSSSWNTFFELLIIVLGIWLFLEAVSRLLPRFISGVNRRTKLVRYYAMAKKGILSIAILGLLINLVSVNYILHGSILILCVLFGFRYIRNFISGLILRLNPLIRPGRRMKVGQFEGDLVKFFPFGLVLVDDKMERFINYLDIDRMGFETINQDEGSLRNSLLIVSKDTLNNTLDLVYGTPLVSLASKPQLSATDAPQVYLLRYTLEKGVKDESFIAYLNSKKITIATKN